MRFIIIVLILLTCIGSFGQCPDPGLKIQSANCDNPSNLKVSSVTCSELKVQWNGSASQTYLVNATGVENANSKSFSSTASKISCDNAGRCSATIPVSSAATIYWNVQGICTEDHARLYGIAVSGHPATSPLCSIAGANTLKLYPNPASRILFFNYLGAVTENTRFIVIDIMGRQAVVVPGNAITRTRIGYQLDVSMFTNGTYLLKIVNGNDAKQGQFVLLKN